MIEDEKRNPESLSWNELGMNSNELRTLERDSLPFLRSFRSLEDFVRILPPLISPKNQ